MLKEKFVDTVGWGFVLWFFGYILGFIFFAFIPQPLLGWAIMPFGTAFNLFVLLKKVSSVSLKNPLLLSVIWTFIAIALDYIFIVLLLRPGDGYYKPDVYLYYFLTFTLPFLVSWKKTSPAAYEHF